jgi:hypothetical protein
MPRFEGAWERADQLEPVPSPSISTNAFLHDDAPLAARRTAAAVNGVAKKSPDWKITVFPTDPAIRLRCLSATRFSLPILEDKSLLIPRIIVAVVTVGPAQSGVPGQSLIGRPTRQPV